MYRWTSLYKNVRVFVFMLFLFITILAYISLVTLFLIIFSLFFCLFDCFLFCFCFCLAPWAQCLQPMTGTVAPCSPLHIRQAV